MKNQEKIDEIANRLKRGSLDDPDAEWKAAMSLGEVKDDNEKRKAINALEEVLIAGNSHALTRVHAVESLGKLGDPKVIPIIINALNDPYRLVRAYAAASLAMLRDQSALEALLVALKNDEFYGTRAEAAKSIANLTPADKNIKKRIIEELEKQNRLEKKLGRVGCERVISEIDRALKTLLKDEVL